MTLKEFMTRGNGGMEKDAVGFDLKPGYTEAGDVPFLYYNPSRRGGTYFAKSPLMGHLLATRDFTPEQSKVYYESHFQDNPELQKQILEEAARLLPYFSNEWNSNKKAFINNLNADDTLKALVKQYNKTNGTNLTPGDFLSSQINNLPLIYRKAFENPGVYKAVGQYPALQRIAKQLGIDPGKVRELVPEMANYDMWQHTPGMAAAFGIPFGIGALLGHPGWGALLGLLGAGGYGYYQYNKMQQALLNGAGNGAGKPEEVPPKTSGPTEETAPDENAPAEPETITKPLPGPPEPDNSSTANTADGEKRIIDPKIQSGEKRLDPKFLGPRGLSPAFNKKETVNRPEYLGPHKQVPGPFGKKVEVPIQPSTQTSPSN